MRYERKYRIEGMSVPAIKQLLKLHPASFRSLYPDRQVNNVYFDTPTLTTFHQNVGGDSERKKYRVRWYGKDIRAIESPNFEVKSKHSELGTKTVTPVAAFELDKFESITQEVNKLIQYDSFLQPSLLNSYGRSYLISMDGKYRLTIDYSLAYHSLINSQRFHAYHITDAAVVLEIKYEEEDDARIGTITQHLPFRQSRHSKYVYGIQMTQ